jgi:hypothetical protein
MKWMKVTVQPFYRESNMNEFLILLVWQMHQDELPWWQFHLYTSQVAPNSSSKAGNLQLDN